MIEHENYVRQCYRLAKSAVEHGNHPFGAMLVKDGIVLLTAENTVNTDHDVTRHAELNLVSMACRKLSQHTIAGAILYTSTEPYAMCAGAIYWTGIATVVFGCSARTLAEITGGDFLMPCELVLSQGERKITIIGPVLESEGLVLHQEFWR